VAGFEADVPEHADQSFEPGSQHAAGLLRKQDQQIDVGSRVQLAAAVAADGDQRQRGRQIKLAPEFAQHLVDKAAAFDEQSRCVTVGCEMLAYGALSFLQVGLEVRDQGVVGKHFRLHRSLPGGT
jgi:hypothetical protein